MGTFIFSFNTQSFLIITYTQRRHDDLKGKDKATERLMAILCFSSLFTP